MQDSNRQGFLHGASNESQGREIIAIKPIGFAYGKTMKKKGRGLMLRKLLAMTIYFVSFAALVVMNLGAAEETINNASDNGSEIGTALLTDYWMDDS